MLERAREHPPQVGGLDRLGRGVRMRRPDQLAHRSRPLRRAEQPAYDHPAAGLVLDEEHARLRLPVPGTLQQRAEHLRRAVREHDAVALAHLERREVPGKRRNDTACGEPVPRLCRVRAERLGGQLRQRGQDAGCQLVSPPGQRLDE